MVSESAPPPTITPDVMIPLRLRVEAAAGGGWKVWLGHRDARSERGHLSTMAVDALRTTIQDALSPASTPTVLLAGDDLELAAAELRAGRALSAVLSASERILSLFAYFRGHASSREEPLLLVIEAEEAEIRALPWELLCDRPDGHHLEGDGLTIARLFSGQPRPPSPSRATLQSLFWCPNPDDPSCAAVIRALTATAEANLLPTPTPLSPAPALAPFEARVLHVIAHGIQDRARLALLIDEERRDANNAVQALHAALPQTDLVVVSVCEAGAAARDDLNSLSATLLAGGARAVVAPAEALSPTAIAVFLRGLYGALGHGASLAGAITEGRRAVRALATPFPDARWRELILAVGDMNLPKQVLWRGWRPRGFPRPSPDAARLLHRARELAEASGTGFVGVEHFALALVAGPVSTPLAGLRHQISANRKHIESRLAGLAAGPGEVDWTGTPRLRRMGVQLSVGFTVEALWNTLIEDNPTLVHRLIGGRIATTADATDITERGDAPPPQMAPGPISGLEILGGPEDGRWLPYTPDAWIGRWSDPPRCALALYADTALRDLSLSRQHLRWRAPSHVEVVRPICLHRGRQPPLTIDVGVIALQANDQIQLGSTWLLASAAGEAR